MMPGTAAGGVQMIARSGADGSAAAEGYTLSPASTECFGLTGKIAPLNPAASRLPSTVLPTLPCRSEAPITATERGLKRYSRLRTVIQALPFESRHETRIV